MSSLQGEFTATGPPTVTPATVTCIACGRQHSLYEANDACRDCGSLLEVVHPLEELRGILTPQWIEGRKLERTFPRGSGVWRWQELVAPFPPNTIVSRNEGNTNLYQDGRLARYAGVDFLWLKHE